MGKLENKTEIHRVPSAGRLSTERCAHIISLTSPHSLIRKVLLLF